MQRDGVNCHAAFLLRSTTSWELILAHEGVVVDVHLLPAVAAGLVRRMDHDLFNQVPQHPRRQLFKVGVLLDRFQKLMMFAVS